MISLRFLSRSTPRMTGWLAALSATIAGAVSGLAWDAGPLAAQAGTGQGYCASETSGPVVYFTPIFDTKFKPRVPIETHAIASELHESLKGRYGYTNRGNYPVRCAVLDSVAAAEANKAVVLVS